MGRGQLGVTKVITSRAAPPPTRSLPIPTPTARVPSTRRERGGAKPRREAEGRNPLEPEKHANPGGLQKALVPVRWRAADHGFQPAFRRPSHLSAHLDHSLTVLARTNQALWVLCWSSFPPFRTPFSPSSPLPAATGIQMHSFSRQNLLASCCRKSAHLCRKVGRRALSYPELCRGAISVD